MKVSQGGMDYRAICDLSLVEFDQYLEAATTLEERIAEASKD